MAVGGLSHLVAIFILRESEHKNLTADLWNGDGNLSFLTLT